MILDHLEPRGMILMDCQFVSFLNLITKETSKEDTWIHCKSVQTASKPTYQTNLVDTFTLSKRGIEHTRVKVNTIIS